MVQEYAFEYETLYTLEDIQAVDPTAALDNDGEFGPVIFAIVEPIEYVFYPDGTGWTLDHTWHGFGLRRSQGRDDAPPAPRRDEG